MHALDTNENSDLAETPSDALGTDADVLASELLEVERELLRIDACDQELADLSQSTNGDINLLQEQLGRHLTKEAEAAIRANLAQETNASSAHRTHMEERRNELFLKLGDALRQRFYDETVRPFLEAFDYSQYYESFEEQLKLLSTEYGYGEHRFLYDIGSLHPPEIMDIKKRSARKLNALNEKRFKERTSQEDRALKDGNTLFVDGRHIPIKAVTFISGVHGDEYSGPDALQEGIRALRSASLEVPVHVESAFNEEGLSAGTRELDGIDLNRETPVGTSASAIKEGKILQIPEGSYVVDFHNCRGDTPPFGITCSFSEENVALAQELGLDMLVICDEKLMSGSVLSDAIRKRKSDGLVVETSSARADSKTDVQRIATKMLSLASAAAGKEVEGKLGVTASERNEHMRLYHAIVLTGAPENDEHYYQVLNGNAVKFVRLEKQGRSYKQIPLSSKEREMFESGGLG